MINRRSFLKGQLALTSLSMLPAWSVMSRGRETKNTPSLLIYNPELAKSTLTQHLKVKTKASIAVNHDLGAIWLRHLRPKLMEGNQYVLGLTSGHQAFSLQQAAQDYGYGITRSAVLPQDINAQVSLLAEGPPKGALSELTLNQGHCVLWLLSPRGVNFRRIV